MPQDTVALNEHFSSSMLGKCFDSGKDFVRSEFHSLPMESGCTSDERDSGSCVLADSVDENIQILQNDKADKFGLFWVIDKTPGNNPDRYLLQKGENERVCLLLFVPSSSVFSWIESAKNGFPLRYSAGVSPLQGLPGWKVDFLYSQSAKVFRPTNCKQVDADTNGVITKISKISCDSVYR
jgi:hypothetical protein